MRVSRLEAFGFKSFMERLVLPLDKGITGVVGPNGCGKSNVVDALRWVLGETRASQLRGGVLEDVIFNGTDKLRPLGLAEVTITLKSDAGDLLDDLLKAAERRASVSSLDEVSVALSGEDVVTENTPQNEHASSERPHLVVLEGGIDSKSHAEFQPEGAGKGLFQEEEGTSSSAAEIAEDENLVRRFGWLKGVTEAQITRRLYRSGESEYFLNRIACRLKDLKDFFRACALGARTYTIVAQGEVGRIISAKPEERRLILEEAAGVLGFRERTNEATRRLEETRTNLTRITDIETELTRQVASLKRQAHRAMSRKELKDELYVLEQRLYRTHTEWAGTREVECAKQSRELTAKAEQLEQQNKLLKQGEEEVQAALLEADTALEKVRKLSDGVKEDLNARARTRMERRGRLQEARAVLSARQTEAQRLGERGQTLIDRKLLAEREIAALEQEDLELTEKLKIQDVGDNRLRELNQQLAELRETLRKKEMEIREIRERMSAQRGSLSTIQDQLIAASPLKQLSQSLGSELVRQISAHAKAFIDGLSVPEKYSRAVQAVLAERAKFLVSPDPHAIAEAFRKYYAGKSDKERKGAGLGVVRSGRDDDSELPIAIEDAEALLTIITVTDECHRAAQLLLRDIYFVESLESARFIFQREARSKLEGLIFVTADGEIITPDSFYSLHHEGGLIQLRLKAQRLQETLVFLEQEHQGHSGERDSIAKGLQEVEGEHARTLRDIQQRQAAIREFGKQQGSVRGRIYAAKNSLQQMKADEARTSQQIADVRARIAELEQRVSVFEADLHEGIPEDDTDLRKVLDEHQQELSRLEAIRKEGRQKVEERSRAVSGVRAELDRTRQAISHLQLELQKNKLERENLELRMWDEFGEETVSQWQKDREQIPLLEGEEETRATQRVHEIRNRIRREGEVDPTAIERYEEEFSRLDPLRLQREDLENAARSIEQSIEELRSTSARRFLETYTQVRRNFSVLAPRLYGGGSADLELTLPNTPLEAGVEIIVRPPGKKPKSIDVLSGGEKALCATALIFAMFLVRPSPLCVLDEVDAPLDEANLLRFLDVIKDMSQHTQFLMITHNKGSMSVAEQLVGITMEQPGASKMLSVSLDEAYQQVA